ncbi:MAG: bifunctional heptose 7-phosphate kinase/heptose 1-phosphate adenyltransferase, partial [Candidatus Binatia bacterium]
MTRSKIQELARIVRRFRRVRLLVVGDLMLDQFVWGKVDRFSPVAPVPVVTVSKESFHLGGAANVAANVRELGGRATVVGVVGRDPAGRQILEELRRIGVGVGGAITSGEIPTTRKTRIVAHQQQLVRLDRERKLGDAKLERRVRDRVQRLLPRFDGIVISDYGKGVITPALLADLAARPAGKPPLFIDPKKGNFPSYRHATMLKPNLEAAQAASGIDVHDDTTLRAAGQRLLESWASESVLVSRGEAGMTLFRRGKRMAHFPTAAREVFDVTGAGDTVLAT